MARAAADPGAAPAPGRAPAGDAAQPPRCRNCGAAAEGAYCPACGQETALALPTARQFLKEAAGRYVALDGRMWRTLAALLFRPGFLTLEYFAGRRRRYVRPARLFLVLSIAVFLVIRLVVGVPELADGAIVIDGDRAQRPAAGEPATAGAANGPAREQGRVLLPGIALAVDDGGNVNVEGAGPVAKALKQRMARFNALPGQERFEQLVLGTLRYGPYAMFVLLPAFALLLWLVYAGPRTRHPRRPRRYAEHLVFAAHTHAFVFLVAALAVLAPWAPVQVALIAWSALYGLWSMRAVYGGRWLGTLARAWLLGIAYLVLFSFVTVGLVVAAVVVR